MAYEVAVNKAWEDLSKLSAEKLFSVRFLSDEYSIDLTAKKVMSLSCNVPAEDFWSVLILHYLIKKLSGLPELAGEWVSFNEAAVADSYYPVFRKRTIEPLIRKYGTNPQGIFLALERIPSKKVDNLADAAIIVEAFDKVPVLVKLWGKDEEFSSDANILFDRSVTEIFCTEDIVVLAGMVAASL